MSNKGILACHGYSSEKFPDAFDMHPFTDRANSLGTGITFFDSIGGLLLIALLAKNCCYELPKFVLNLFELDLIFTCYLISQMSV